LFPTLLLFTRFSLVLQLYYFSKALMLFYSFTTLL
jgi:hypothetical protein